MRKTLSIVSMGLVWMMINGCDHHNQKTCNEEVWSEFNTTCLPLQVSNNYGYGDLAFDKDGNLLIAGDSAGTVLGLNRETCELSTLTTIAGENVLSVVDNGSYVYAGTGTGVFEIDRINGTYTKIITSNYINSMVIAPNNYGSYGGNLIYASYNSIYAYDLNGGNPPINIYSDSDAISDLVFGSDGTLYAAVSSGIVTVESDGTVENFLSMTGVDGLTIDNNGSTLFVTNDSVDKLYSVDVTSKTVTELSDFDFDSGYYPTGIVFDGYSTLIMKTGETEGTLRAFNLDD
ncbi:MAG: PQQ-like beta-propeller repeat protein [Campylobacterales bacterium]|nr:PQQ-like beta-propeller repeat protein [Campylobacterales bacterium]